MALNTIVVIAGGGAIGAVMRYGINVLALKLAGSGFPWATLGVNVAGSFVMGLLVAVFAHFWQPSHEIKAFLLTGLLGAFTTFSAFSLDVVSLWERGAVDLAVIYALGSVILSVGALLAAMFLVRGLAV